MSETETAPQGGGAAVPESAATDADTETLAPGTEGAAPPVESTPAEELTNKLERRFATLRARVSAGEQQVARLVAENEQLRRGAPEGAPSQEVHAEAQRLAAEMVQAERAKERMDRFHTEGRAAHADWSDRCQNLMSMGADAGLSHILVEMDNGARVAGALADDPEALERIAAIKTERGRAISLGMYAAQLAEKPAPPVRRVSNAPAPIRPVTGSAPVTFNEYTATSDQLTAYYEQQSRKARGL